MEPSTTQRLGRRERPAANPSAPDGLLVLLHGRGANADDLFPLLAHFDPEARLHGVTLEAPYVPQGQYGHHWYVVHRVGFPHEETFTTSLRLLEHDVDALLAEHGLTHDQLVIGGFSQGAVMSIATALGTGRPRPAAVIPWSGFVPTVEGWELDAETAKDVPVLLAHGSLDPVITIDFGRDAKARLEAAGAAVEYREVPMQHEIDPESIVRARELILDAVPVRA